MAGQEGFYAALSGGVAQERRLEILANNLANINTAGYKKDVLSFKSVLGTAENALGNTDYVDVASFRTDFSQGGVIHTGNPLDLTIRGDGFFEIETANGTRYTRQGTFSLDASNRLVTQNGDPVVGSGGPLTLDGGAIMVGDQGDISVDGSPAGTIKIVQFTDPDQLEKAGASLFRHKGDEGNITTRADATVAQGFIETSNVDPVVEMVRMIEISKAYSSYQKVIQSMDDASKKLISELGRF